jgi:hypothetical protein
MHCEDAARALIADDAAPDLEIHLSACDACRLLAEDLREIQGAFRAARTSWAPRKEIRVRPPLLPWRRLAIAASLLLLPLAGWAVHSLRPAAEPRYMLLSVLDPGPARAFSDRELLGSLFLEEGGR